MPKKKSMGFGEGVQSTFAQTAHDVMMQTLREMAAQPEQESQMRLRDAQIKHLETDDTLNPREQAALESAYKLPQGSLTGVRRQVVGDLLPKSATDLGTGRVTVLGPGGRVAQPAPVAIDANTGEQVALPRGARVVTNPGTAENQRQTGIIQSFKSTFGKYSELLDKIPSGRILGGGADLLNKYTGAFPEAKAARALEGVMTPMAARILGGDVGNLNENEQTRVRDAVSFMSGTLKERKQGAEILLSLLSEKEKGLADRGLGMFKKPAQAKQASASAKPEKPNSDPLGIR